MQHPATAQEQYQQMIQGIPSSELGVLSSWATGLVPSTGTTVPVPPPGYIYISSHSSIPYPSVIFTSAPQSQMAQNLKVEEPKALEPEESWDSTTSK